MSNNLKICREVAEQEVGSWLDFKKVKDKKREDNKDNIDALVEAVMDGIVTITEDKTIIQRLSVPIGANSEAITQISFKPRLKVSTVRVCTQGIKSTDTIGIAGGYVSAATGVDRNVINTMDMEDFSVSQSIVIFFL
jgi:hypothetical protein